MIKLSFEKTIVFLSVILFVLAGYISCVKHTKHDKPVGNIVAESNHYKSIVRVSSISTFILNPPMYGTAFAVDKDFLFTAGHICKMIEEGIKEGNMREFILLTPADQKGQPSILESTSATIVHYIDEGNLDLCLLKSSNHNFPVLHISKNYSEISTGDPIKNIGCPHGVLNLVEDGRIITVTDERLYLNLFVEPGSSGSPVFWRGEVVGMIVSYHNGEGGQLRRISHAISAPILQKFFNIHGD